MFGDLLCLLDPDTPSIPLKVLPLGEDHIRGERDLDLEEDFERERDL
jgi:hypothetical protein